MNKLTPLTILLITILLPQFVLDAYSLKADAKCHLAVRCQIIKKSNWCYIVYATYGMKTEMHENKLRIPVLGWVNRKYLQKDNDPYITFLSGGICVLRGGGCTVLE